MFELYHKLFHQHLSIKKSDWNSHKKVEQLYEIEDSIQEEVRALESKIDQLQHLRERILETVDDIYEEDNELYG